MRKKMIGFAMVVCMLATLGIASPISASTVTNMCIGDYVQMGTYYGAPILWRCVDKDENGPLMLSDKIICLKPFDASGTNSQGSHSIFYGEQGYGLQFCGSNYWADSNMRCWLNSAAPAGNVNWLCGNPPYNSHVCDEYNAYADEAGFLTNFTQGERNAIKEVTHKSLLYGYEYSGSSYTINSDNHRYNTSISNVVQNYDTAFSEQVTDRMFLLDVKQLNRVYQNDSLLDNNNYYIGIPTAEAVQNSEYKNSSLTATARWWSWLSSPYASDDACIGVRYVSSDGSVNNSLAYEGDGGVRPAFYLNLPSALFVSGNGTKTSPYTVLATANGSTRQEAPKGITLNKKERTMKVGETYKLQVTVSPINAKKTTVTWLSSNQAVATVSSKGVVTAIKKGTAKITATTANSKTATCKITVNPKSNILNYDNYEYSFDNSADSFGYYRIKGNLTYYDYKIPEKRYIQAGISKAKAKKLKSQIWGGSCFGMSASSVLFYKNVLKEERYKKGVAYPIDFDSPNAKEDTKEKKKLREMIELFQVSQFRDKLWNINLSGNLYWRDKADIAVPAVAAELDKGNPVVFGITGHAVVVYGYEKKGDNYTFYIYDCSGFVSSVTYNNGAWSFTYLDDTYVWHPHEYYTYDVIKKQYDQIRKKNIKDAINLFSIDEDPSYMYIITPAQNMTIVNSQNQVSTIVDGEISGEIENISLKLSDYLAEEQIYTIIAPTDTYTITGTDDESLTTSVADDYISVDITHKASTPITVSDNLYNITIGTSENEAYSIQYTTYDNIFDEMTLCGTACGEITTTLDVDKVHITGAKTVNASATVSEEASTAAAQLPEGKSASVACAAENGNTIMQITVNNVPVTENVTLAERRKVSTPTYDLAGGSYTKGQILQFTKDDDTVIYYTTDESEPNEVNGSIYSLPIEINKSVTIKAIATKYGYENSDVLTLEYHLPQISAPTVSLAEGTYAVIGQFELEADEGTNIYYTLDGSDPLEGVASLYSFPIVFTENITLKAYAEKDGCVSDVITYSYRITPAETCEIKGLYYDDTSVKANIISNEAKSGFLLVACYDEQNKLICVQMQEAAILKNALNSFFIDMDTTTATKVSAFLWDSLDTMNPLCNAESIYIG